MLAHLVLDFLADILDQRTHHVDFKGGHSPNSLASREYISLPNFHQVRRVARDL